MKSALILYPHQLFPLDKLPDVQTVFVVEEPLIFGADPNRQLKLHKQKLILLRSALRRYVEEVLWQADFKVEYIDLDVFFKTGEILERTKQFDQVYVFDPLDVTLASRLLETRRNRDDLPPLEFLPSPNFYLNDVELRQYFGERHKHAFADFYQWQRERFNVLIDNYKPIGGKWQLQAETDQAKTDNLPSFAVFGENKHVQEAIFWVEEHFSDNPGSTDFIWPTNHQEAKQWLDDFVTNRLQGFAAYHHNIDGQAAWLYHSALSSSLNLGLLSPQEVVEAVVSKYRKNPELLVDAELVVRLVLGEREFARGLYITKQDALNQDVFKNVRRLSNAWYQGGLGLPPYDDVAKKLQAKAYAHGIERAVIVGGLMIMSDIHRDDIINFFRQMFIDGFDWSILPAVYRLEQLLSEDFGDTPAVNPSSFIIEQSNYERGLWADIWDGLFWRFVEKHHVVLSKQPALRAATQRFGRLDADRKRIISYRADDFLKQFTN